LRGKARKDAASLQIRNIKEGEKRASKKLKEKAAKLGDDELAKRELARRELMRRKLPEYQAGWIHADICARLERFYADIQAGRSPRLMLFMPPRHGKSTIASKLFPAWAFGQDP
jgi:hypothetical protein